MSAGAVFVVGFPRSGTSLLQSLIGSHPAIAACPETFFFFRMRSLVLDRGSLADDAAFRRAVTIAVSPVFPFDPSWAPTVDEILTGAAGRPRTVATILDVVLSAWAARAGKPRWSEKTPGEPAGVVFRHVPDAQVVHIVRRPADVVASGLAMPWNNAPATVIAARWRRFVVATRRAGTQAGPGRYAEVRYEDLVAQPRQCLATVLRFLGEDPSGADVEDLGRRAPALPADVPPWLVDVVRPVDRGHVGRRSLPWGAGGLTGLVARSVGDADGTRAVSWRAAGRAVLDGPAMVAELRRGATTWGRTRSRAGREREMARFLASAGGLRASAGPAPAGSRP